MIYDANKVLSFILVFLLVNTVFNVLAQIKYNVLIKKIRELWLFVENGFFEDLYKIEQEELATLGNETEQERGIQSYYATQRNDINMWWKNYKVQGLEIFADNAAINFINAAGREALKKTGFPDSFLQKVDNINRLQIESFLNKLRLKLSISNNHEEIIKEAVLDVYRKNIRSTYELFRQEMNKTDKIKIRPLTQQKAIELKQELETKIILTDDPKLRMKYEQDLEELNNYI